MKEATKYFYGEKGGKMQKPYNCRENDYFVRTVPL